MLGKTKMPILAVLILASLSLAGVTIYLLQNERTKNLNLHAELDSLKTRQKITETKLKDSQQAVSNLETQLAEANSKINILTSELDKEKATRQDTLAQIDEARAYLEQEKKLKSNLETNLNQAQEDIQKARTQLKALESDKRELEAKIKELQAQAQSAQTQSAQAQGVELGKIVVNPEPDAQKPQENVSVKPLEANVLVVNRDYNFAVINLGSKDGVNVGDIFSVYHNANYIGDVNIEKVHDAMSATGPISAPMKDSISEGDKVVRKIK